MRLSLCNLPCILLVAAASASTQDSPSALAAKEPFDLHRFTLDNGLRVWCQPRPDSKSVAAYLVVRVGSRYETVANNGIAHFVEHMLFTGTERWDETHIKERITDRGGRWNGRTGKETTRYFAETPVADFDIAMDWLAEVVFHPTFLEDKVEKERNVVLQERWAEYGWLVNKLEQVGFGYDLGREVRERIFPGSALAFRTIGEDSSLASTDRGALLEFYRTHYVAGNMCLILVGNVTIEQALEAARKYFGDAPSGGSPPHPAVPEVPKDGPHQVIVRGPLFTNQCELQVGARTVGLRHTDRGPLAVLGYVLHMNLMKEIRHEKGLVYGVRARTGMYSDVGCFSISTRVERANLSLVRSIIKQHLERMRAGEIDPQDVSEAKAALKGQWALRMETNAARASWMMRWAFLLGEDEPLPDYEALTDSVTPDDLCRVVRTYFTPERSFVGTHIPIMTANRGALCLSIFVALVSAGVVVWRIRRRKKRDRERDVGVAPPLS